jgi:hypothetical protein
MQSNLAPDRHALDRSIGVRRRRQPAVPVEDVTDPSSDESEEFSTRPIRPKTWTDAEITRLKAVTTDLADALTRTWEMVSQQMPGHSPKPCEQRYKCLTSMHAFSVAVTRTRSEGDEIWRCVNSVIGIHFHFRGKLSYVGVESECCTTAAPAQ